LDCHLVLLPRKFSSFANKDTRLVDEEPRFGDQPLGVGLLLRERLLCRAAAASAVCVRPVSATVRISHG